MEAKQLANNNFQVDLGGIVELLSRNLYSGPRVFVREILQNGYDAITARQKIDPSCPTKISFYTDGKTIKVVDSGIGLTITETEQLLATIGASSKRDELGLARTDYLGQFGIGLLSCFMVSNTITVYSRSGHDAHPQTVKWQGNSNGTWQVSIIDSNEAPRELYGIGTCILLECLPGESHFDFTYLQNLITEYGEFLPVKVELCRLGTIHTPHILTNNIAPWDNTPPEQARWCAENMGFMPFSLIELKVPQAGLSGVGFVLASGANPGQAVKHQVYLRNILLSKAVTDLLPPWAYFVRVVLNTKYLKPTASREQIFDDDLLELTRQELGKQIRTWLQTLAQEHPELFYKFTSLHLNGLKSLAITDRPTRDLLAANVPYHTSLGMMPIDEIIQKYGTIRYTSTDNEFHTLEPVASANNICIVNGGFAFDEELLGQLALDRPQARIQPLSAFEVLGALEPLSSAEEADLLPVISHAQDALSQQQVQVEIRRFQPANMPVLYLPDSDIASINIEKQAQETATGEFSDLINLINNSKVRPSTSQTARLIFNANCSLIYELAGSNAINIIHSAVRGLYLQALLAGRHPLNTQARSWSTSIFTTLISNTLQVYKDVPPT